MILNLNVCNKSTRTQLELKKRFKIKIGVLTELFFDIFISINEPEN